MTLTSRNNPISSACSDPVDCKKCTSRAPWQVQKDSVEATSATSACWCGDFCPLRHSQNISFSTHRNQTEQNINLLLYMWHLCLCNNIYILQSEKRGIFTSGQIFVFNHAYFQRCKSYSLEASS